MRLKCVGWSAVAVSLLTVRLTAAVAVPEGSPKNGLSSAALRRNALTTNAQALQALMHHPLKLAPDDTLFSDDADTRAQLHDPRARAIMEEIVKCALRDSAVVRYEDPSDGNKKYAWSGELGLCDPQQPDPSDPEQPVWGPGGPSKVCQQLVTACVVARVNGLGRSIPLSIRGPSSTLFPPREAVATERRFRESPPGEDPAEGTLNGSFMGPLCLQGHDCLWAPAFVGRCDHGTISLAIQDASACQSTPVRVCAGIHGCYRPGTPDKPPPGFPDDPKEQYVHHIKDRPGACVGSEITFPCPTALPIGGYYSVMTRPAHVGTGIQPTHPTSPTVIKTAGPGAYPASEHEAFTFLEGAFYGNLFAPDELTWNCVVNGDGIRTCTPSPEIGGDPERCPLRFTVDASGAGAGCHETQTVPYRNVYACYSLAQQLDSDTDDEALGVAYLNSRICNEPDPEKTCFFHKPRRCHFADPVKNAKQGSHCEWLGDAGVYQHCKSLDGDPVISYPPVTTYLNDPCDLLSHDGLCTRVRRSLVSPRGAGAGAVVRHGCAGCSVDGGGGLQALSSAVFVGLALRARRRRRAS